MSLYKDQPELGDDAAWSAPCSKCKHPRSWHLAGADCCKMIRHETGLTECKCRTFVPIPTLATTSVDTSLAPLNGDEPCPDNNNKAEKRCRWRNYWQWLGVEEAC